MSTDNSNAQLPDGCVDIEEVAGVGGAASTLGHRRARSGELRDAYPSGDRDIELSFAGQPQPEAMARYTAALLEADPRCRRVVLAVPELDLDAIGWAQDAGFRYVIDVETLSGGFSLLVTEPQWAIDQPAILEDIPLKE